MSFGYKKEAIKFYEKVLELKPHNQYVKFLIFINLNNNDLNKNKKRIYFEKYKKLLFIFSTNQLLYLKYHQLSKDIGNKVSNPIIPNSACSNGNLLLSWSWGE